MRSFFEAAVFMVDGNAEQAFRCLETIFADQKVRHFALSLWLLPLALSSTFGLRPLLVLAAQSALMSLRFARSLPRRPRSTWAWWTACSRSFAACSRRTACSSCRVSREPSCGWIVDCLRSHWCFGQRQPWLSFALAHAAFLSCVCVCAGIPLLKRMFNLPPKVDVLLSLTVALITGGREMSGMTLDQLIEQFCQVFGTCCCRCARARSLPAVRASNDAALSAARMTALRCVRVFQATTRRSCWVWCV